MLRGEKTMIIYSCRDVIKGILKRWYIIAGVIMGFAIMSIPLANASYKNATSDYEKLMQLEDTEEKYNTQIYYSIETENEEDSYIYLDCFANLELMDSICNAQNENSDWNKLYEKLQYSYIEDGKVFKVLITDTTEEEVSFINDAITDWLADYLEDKGFGEITFQEKLRLQDEIEKETIYSSLLSEPVEPDNRVKIVGQAVVFGIVLGSFVTLLLDFKERKNFYDKNN